MQRLRIEVSQLRGAIAKYSGGSLRNQAAQCPAAYQHIVMTHAECIRQTPTLRKWQTMRCGAVMLRLAFQVGTFFA